jgi:hypothetical protein
VPLRVLLTNAVMRGRTGTEIVTRDIALGLLQAGHAPTVYSPICGDIAEELEASGVTVKANVTELEGPFDVIHGHHLPACVAVLARFPEIPAISVCHDGESWFDTPPVLPTVVRYAAVSEVLVRRVAAETRASPDHIDLVLNGVDTGRFQPGLPLPPTPSTAVAFAKNPEHVEAVRLACAARGLAVDFIGAAVGNVVSDPETVLPRYDLVFASAVSALEAMACARAVIVCDGRGLAGMVDRRRLEEWRPHNFGLATLANAVTPASIVSEIDRYDAKEAAAVAALVRECASLQHWIAAYERVYAKAIAAFRPQAPQANALAWARHLQQWAPRWHDDWLWSAERQSLLHDLRRRVAGLEVTPRRRPVDVGVSGNGRDLILLTGFEGTNAHSAWTTQPFCSVQMHLGELAGDVEFEISYSTRLAEADAELETTVLVNGLALETWLDSCHADWVHNRRLVRAPRETCRGIATWLSFRIARRGAASSPPPSFALHSIEVRD